MTNDEKNNIYLELKNKYIFNQNEKIEDILDELSTQNTRSLVILGCAYLEELCKECVLASMTIEGKKEFKKRHNREFTFSFASTILFSLNYISLDIFKILNYIRDIRNKYAHETIIHESLKDSIKSRTESLRELLNKRWLTLNPKRIRRLRDQDDQLYFIVFENLCMALLALEKFINPHDKIAKLQFIDGQTNLKISILTHLINENTLQNFENKYKN